ACDAYLLSDRLGKPLAARRLWREKDRQAVAGMLPEVRGVQQALDGVEHRFRIVFSDASGKQFRLCTAQQCLQAYRILERLRAAPVGRQVERDAGLRLLSGQAFDGI